MRTRTIPIAALVLALVLAFLVPAVSANGPGPIKAYICITGSDSSQLTPGTSRWQNAAGGPIAFFNDGMEGGCLYENIPAGTTNIKVWTSYNNTTSQPLTQNISSSPTFDFYTHKLTLKLTKCDDTPLNGGTARMKVGGVTYFFPAPNSTGTDGDGKTSAEVFPGTYDFEMNYNATAEWKYGETIPDADHELHWKTTLVSLNWPGQISYGGPVGDGTWFGKPAMEMMPGTVRFHFRPVDGHPGYTSDLTFSGCTYAGGFLTLVDELGNPLATYPVDYATETRNLKWKYRCGGSWGPTTSFQTDAYGRTFYSIDCSSVGSGKGKWDNKITMTLNQTTVEQDVTQNATFQAAKVNANLKGCNPETPLSGGAVDQGGGYWYHHGDTGPTGTATFYTFPTNGGTIKLRMGYNHASETKYPSIAAGTNEVDFQATKVTLNHPGDIKSNKGGSWWMFSKPSMYLLPGDYSFWFKTGSKWSGPVVLNVSDCSMDLCYRTVSLKDSGGNLITNSGATILYQPNSSGGYIPFGDGALDASGQEAALVPCGRHRYRLTYLGAMQEKQTDSADVLYQTQDVTVELRDSGDGLITGSDATVLWQSGSAGPYVQFGSNAELQANGQTSMEVLPVSNRYRLTYLGATQEKQTSSATATYKTHSVTVELLDAGNNYVTGNDATILWQSGSSGGYVQFGSNAELQANGHTSMETLPLTNRYRMTYLSKTKEKQSGSATVTYHVADFQ